MVSDTSTDHIPRNTAERVLCFSEGFSHPNGAMHFTIRKSKWQKKTRPTILADYCSTVSLKVDHDMCCYPRNLSIQHERKHQHPRSDSRLNLTAKTPSKSLRLSTRVTVWCLVLLVFLATVGVRADMSAFSPGSVLSTISGDKTSMFGGEAPRTQGVGKNAQRSSVPESEVMQHLYKNGARDQALTSASTSFMMHVFNNLLAGRSLPEAVGAKKNKRAIGRSDTVRSFPGSDKAVQAERGGHMQVKFRLPLLPPKERLRAAEVRVRNHGTLGGTLIRQRAKLRLKIWAGGKRESSKAVTRVRPTIEDQYIVFNLGNILDPWINEGHGNMTMTLRLPEQYVLPLATKSASIGEGASAVNRFMIVLFLEDREFFPAMYRSYTQGEEEEDLMQGDQAVEKSRQKRHKGRNRRLWRRRNRGPCELVDYFVDFDVIGWGPWVVEPRVFNSRFCFGECSATLNMHYNLTNHAIMQTLMRMRKRSVAPSPCCVPTKLRPISMLYFEYGQIMLRHLPDMIATECGCR